jgi:hypothetical protein
MKEQISASGTSDGSVEVIKNPLRLACRIVWYKPVIRIRGMVRWMIGKTKLPIASL